MILDMKFRSGLLTMLCGFFVLGTASFCFAEEGETEMTQADSIKKAGQHLSFGVRYLKSKQYEDAETQFLKSFGFNPKRARTARELGKLYEEIEEYEDAIQWFQKAVELDPKSKYTKIAHIALARIYIIQEQPEKAIGSYEALLEFNLESEEKIKYYHALVSLNVETKEYEKALEYAKNWGELAPDEPEVRDMIGKLHLQTGGEDEALIEMEKVLEVLERDPEVRDMIDKSHLQTGGEDEALLKKLADYYAKLEELADIYQRRGDDDKAFEAFEKLYQNDVSSVFFLEETIQLGKKVGKSKSWIVNRLEKLYAMQPDNLAVIEELAELTEKLKWVNKGLEQDPKNGRYPYMKGDHYFDRWENSSAKQDSINALTWFRRALKDPQWKGNANAMILTLDPPLTEVEKKRREFFEGSKQKKEEVETEGKK